MPRLDVRTRNSSNFSSTAYTYNNDVSWGCAGTTRFDSTTCTFDQVTTCSDTAAEQPEISNNVAQIGDKCLWYENARQFAGTSNGPPPNRSIAGPMKAWNTGAQRPPPEASPIDRGVS